jgi:hypothetical protein
MGVGDAKTLPIRTASVLLLLLCILLNWHEPLLSGPGLDASWEQATEFAVKSHLVFGRDYVFTYGPYHYLVTRLFDPATFGRVLVFDAFAIVAALWTSIRNRSLTGVAGFAICMVLLWSPSDAVNTCALFGIFLIALEGRWGPVFVAASAPLLLAKLSFAPVFVPLVLLADLYRLIGRRAPVLTITLVAALVIADLAAGQPLSALPDFAFNSLAIIGGYSAAMQWPGPIAELLGTVALSVGVVIASLVLAVRAQRAASGPHQHAPIFIWVGFAWTLFVAFKMAFVRQDLHTLTFHQAAPTAFALLLGAFDRPEWRAPWNRAVGAVIFLMMVLASIYWRSDIMRNDTSTPVRPLAEVAEAARDLEPRLRQGFGWLTGQQWATSLQLRGAIDAGLSRKLPAGLNGSVDVIPWESAPLIRSNFDYRPRPVAQSYSSYTARLQALDLRYFQQRAPDLLFLKVEDIDNRLPTLALGPSLPEIGRRYDAVSTDPLGLVLHRRAAPRSVTTETTRPAVAGLDQWIPLPRASGLVMAHIRLRPSLLGRLAGIAYRQPLSWITLRDSAGHQAKYRFVPGMAELGVAVSPTPVIWGTGAPTLLDPVQVDAATAVQALKLSARPWAFLPPEVWFETVHLAPGFAAGLPLLPRLGAVLTWSDPRHEASYDGKQIFAHAPTRLNASLSQPLHLRGVVGLRPQPDGTAPGDGVRFRISAETAASSTVLFEKIVKPGQPAAPFEVRSPAHARLVLETETLATANYDWSYWGELEVLK